MRLQLLHVAVSAAMALAGFGTFVYVVFLASYFRGFIVAALGAALLTAIGLAGIVEAIQEIRRDPD